jgi:hypothetical protein
MTRSLVGAILACATPLLGQAPARRDVPGVRADVRLLAAQLPQRHPAPFRWITAAQWDSATQRLEQRLPTLTRNQVRVGVMRLVAMLGDAHTTVEPTPSLGLRYYPLELYDFDDGLYVRRADSTGAGLVGARVLRIGAVSAAEALGRVSAIVPHENDWWVRAWGPFWLMIPEILDGLGLATDVEHLPLVVERNGRVDTVHIAPTGRFSESHGGFPVDMNGWVTMRQGPAPYWEQHPDHPFWWTIDPASRALYVAMRAVVPGPQSGTNRAQWDEIFALIDSVAPPRVVLDLRENMGGNGGLNRYPIQQILRRPADVFRRAAVHQPARVVDPGDAGGRAHRTTPEPVRGSPAAGAAQSAPHGSDLDGVPPGAERIRRPQLRATGDLHAAHRDGLPAGDRPSLDGDSHAGHRRSDLGRGEPADRSG